MVDICSKTKGCRLVWTCTGTNGIDRPIGKVTAGTINSSENTDNTGYFAGSLSDDQTPIEKTTVDGEEIYADEKRFGILQEDGSILYYDMCNNSSTCTDEVSLTVDYCFAQGTTAATDCDQVTENLKCQDTCHLKLQRVNLNGTLTTLYSAEDAKITSKNRTLPGGTSTDSNFVINFTVDSPVYSNCFH